MNAHVKTRLAPLSRPYVERCKRAGILPLHPIRSPLAEPDARPNLLNRRMEIPREPEPFRVHGQCSVALREQRRLCAFGLLYRIEGDGKN